MLIAADTVRFPAVSRARALRACGPFAVVRESHTMSYGAAGVFVAQSGAVEEELHARNADVVGRIGPHGHVAREGAAGERCRHAHRGRCVGDERGERDGRGVGAGDAAVIRSRQIARERVRARSDVADPIRAVEAQVHQRGPAVEGEVHVADPGEVTLGAVTDRDGGAGDGGAARRLQDQQPRWIVDRDRDGRGCRVPSGVTRPGANGVWAVGGGARVPHDFERRYGVLVAHRRAIEEELHADHGFVVSRVGSHGHVASEGAAGKRGRHTHRGRCVGDDGRKRDRARIAPGNRTRSARAR